MHNMHDSHVRVSYQDKPGFLQQIQGSVCAGFFGILLVISAFPVLYWNEVSLKQCVNLQGPVPRSLWLA